MLPAVCNDLTAWQAESRMRAAVLLRTCLLHAEGCIAQHLDALMPALAKARPPAPFQRLSVAKTAFSQACEGSRAKDGMHVPFAGHNG